MTAPDSDRRPVELGVGYGVPYADPTLEAGCATCKAPAGTPCTRRRGEGSHKTRGYKVRPRQSRASFNLFLRLEREALAADRDGPLWWFASIAHRCGVAGAHRMTDCRPVEGQSGPVT